MSFSLPFGFNRADGVTNLPAQTNGLVSGTAGTQSPAPSITATGRVATEQNYVEEERDSPEIERAEQGTAQHRFKMLWQSAINYISVLGRGTFITDGFGNRWRVLSSKIQSLGGGMASLSVTSESISFDSPPDEFQIVPVELGVDILKHPRYSWALLPWTTDSSTKYEYTIDGTSNKITIYVSDVKQSIIRMIQTFRDTPYLASGDNINGYVQSSIISTVDGKKCITTSFKNPNFSEKDPEVKPDKDNFVKVLNNGNVTIPTKNYRYFTINIPLSDSNKDAVNIALAAATEIIFKLWRGEDTPAVSGYEITYSQYYFAPTYLNPGGYTENPKAWIPSYFMSPSQNGTDSIFDELTKWNPQSYASDRTIGGPLAFSCLRCPDEVDYQRTWFKVTRKWKCSPVGYWDPDFYSGLNGPKYSTDFHTQGYLPQ